MEGMWMSEISIEICFFFAVSVLEWKCSTTCERNERRGMYGSILVPHFLAYDIEKQELPS